MFRNKSRQAFTLIEIMIVVLIIGILLAIAIPNFVRARESSRQKACISNLKQIQSAKEQWAMDNRKGQTDSVAIAALVGATLYMKDTPKCPAGGAYDAGADVNANPTCDYANTTFPHTINALN
jgi:prepilin-type N-terminal cleavage/methylation domain-containing protein